MAAGDHQLLVNPSNGNLLLFKSTTGDYQFTRCGSGIVLSGKGTVTKRGSLVTLQDATAGRKVLANDLGEVGPDE